MATANVVLSENRHDDVDAEKQPSPVKHQEKRKATEEILPGKENGEPRVKRQRINRDLSAKYGTNFLAPVLWTADATTEGKAMFVDETRCIVGTRDGRVIELDHDGKFVRQFRLEGEVGGVLVDGDSLYAWCHSKNSYDEWKGALYDLTGEVPRKLFNLQEFGEKVLHAAVVDGCLALGDDKGNVALLGCGGKLLWKKEQTDGDGRFFAADKSGIYFGHTKVLRRYSLDSGDIMWQHSVASDRFSSIKSGTMDEESVYIEVCGRVRQLNKADGQLKAEFAPVRHRAEGVCVGNGLLVTGSCPTVLFDLKTAQEAWRLDFSGRLSDATMRLHKSGKLFVFWDKVYCINVTSQGIQRALGGTSTRTFEREVPDLPNRNQDGGVPLEQTRTVDGAVMVTCTEEDGKVIVRPTSAGYNNEWPVSFPEDLAKAGRRYTVQRLTASERGAFYSIFGTIKSLNMDDTETMLETAETQDEKPHPASESGDPENEAAPTTTAAAVEEPKVAALSSERAAKETTVTSTEEAPDTEIATAMVELSERQNTEDRPAEQGVEGATVAKTE